MATGLSLIVCIPNIPVWGAFKIGVDKRDPNTPPYVKVGQHVIAGDILLLIEAMKTFNEIKAPKSGVIKKIVALNSQPVEFGETLVIFD